MQIVFLLDLFVFGFCVGFSVFTTRAFQAGDFLLEYRGMLCCKEPLTADTFVYEFEHDGKDCWLVSFSRACPLQTLYIICTTQRCASAVFAVIMCPPVRPSVMSLVFE